jgi:transposase
MEASQLYTARVQVVEAMEQGFSWHEAASRAGIKISQSMAYRLRQRMRQGGKQALPDGRHGHPAKLRGEVRMWLEQTCRQAPHTPSHEIQTQLAQQFSLQISVSQINRVRATLGVSNPPQSTKKNGTNPRQSKSGRKGREGCCCWLLPARRIFSPSWKQPYQPNRTVQVYPGPLHHVFSTHSRSSCSPSCSCLRWDSIGPGIYAATQDKNSPCLRVDRAPTVIVIPNAFF